MINDAFLVWRMMTKKQDKISFLWFFTKKNDEKQSNESNGSMNNHTNIPSKAWHFLYTFRPHNNYLNVVRLVRSHYCTKYSVVAQWRRHVITHKTPVLHNLRWLRKKMLCFLFSIIFFNFDARHTARNELTLTSHALTVLVWRLCAADQQHVIDLSISQIKLWFNQVRK